MAAFWAGDLPARTVVEVAVVVVVAAEEEGGRLVAIKLVRYILKDREKDEE